MIPKKIHYCWFGGNEKPKLFKKCYKSWKKYCPGYEIIEWNESNFDISSCPLYVRQAYEAKKWAFVTDYVRLKVIYDNGGIYFDTDVELKKCPDFLLEYKAFFGFEKGILIATGLGFGAEKGTTILYEMMQDYEDIYFVKDDGTFDLTPCPVRNTDVFIKYGLVREDTQQLVDGNIIVLPTVVLCPLDYTTGKKNLTKETIAIHWFSASWVKNIKYRTLAEQNRKDQNRRKFTILIYKIKCLPNYVILTVIGEKKYNELKNFLGRR